MSASGGGRRIKLVRKTLADGTIKTYRYDLAQIAEQKAAQARDHGFERLAQLYFASPEFARVTPGWQRQLRGYVATIAAEIGYMTIDDLASKEAKREFWALRDKFVATRAKADKIVSTLSLVLGWAYRRDLIDYNHADKIDRLVPSTHSRADIIWHPQDEAAFSAVSGQALWEAWQMALYTLARESDLCAWKWENFDGRWLVYQPPKTRGSTGVTVHIPVYRLEPLRDLVANLSRCTDYMLTSDRGHPWKATTLSRAFERTRAKATLSRPDLNWHDIRGTGMTRLYLAGCTDAEVASISGHVMGDRAQQRSYIARTRGLAEHAFDKLGRYLKSGAQVVPLFGGN